MTATQAKYSISKICRALEVSRSAYYMWLQGRPSRRILTDAFIGERVAAIHAKSRRCYGRDRIHAELKSEGHRTSIRRVGRLMRERGLRATPWRRKPITTIRSGARPAPDLVDRDFSATRADELWVSDITYVPTRGGNLYLAVILDVWSRRVVGWALEEHMRTELVLAALESAVQWRRPRRVIHHSDQGCQYTSIDFQARCFELGVRVSMGSVGDCYDNAMAESFNATLERELLSRGTFENKNEARAAIFEFIESWYNVHRRHSALGYLSPANFEKRMEKAA
jgi:putative transposase